LRDLEAVAADAVDAAVMVHRAIGPGLLESVYELLLAAELERRGHNVLRQQPVTFSFNGMTFENAFRADLIVDAGLVIEVKSIERLSGVHAKQLLTYLRLMQQPLGLLMNFGGETMKEGLKRVINSRATFAP
jgi:GxxExxY protein